MPLDKKNSYDLFDKMGDLLAGQKVLDAVTALEFLAAATLYKCAKDRAGLWHAYAVFCSNLHKGIDLLETTHGHPTDVENDGGGDKDAAGTGHGASGEAGQTNSRNH